ncbi:MAG: glycosyltransferase family 4 protein [Solirubrobacterales bacterium]|nr:glycosyltransferase family 4 protein [Solirubrobacterales bacterium]
MTDLIASVHTPALRSGRALRTYGVARALAELAGGVRIVYVRFGADEPDAAFRAIPGVELHEVVSSRGPARIAAFARARLAGVPPGLARGVSPELARAVERLADPDGRVVADGPTEAASLAGLARRRPVVYNAHNLESAFRHELAERGFGSPRQLRRFERSLLARSSESWMVSEGDVAAAAELRPGARLRLVPNVVDVAAIEPVVADTAARTAVLVANFSYEPNRTALAFLLDEVAPRLWRELPEARLRIVGAGLPGPPSSDPRVEALGFVDDVRDAYRGASAVVVPLLQGGGTPLKLVEALAYGLPVVATGRAAAALGLSDGVECLVADGPEAYAATLARVLREGAPEVAARGRAAAADRYSVEALVRALG